MPRNPPTPNASTAPWPAVVAPQAPRHDHWIQQLGRTRNDPYAWLRFEPATGSRTLDQLPDALRAHLSDEMRYAEAMLQPLAALQQQFYARMADYAPTSAVPLSMAKTGWSYQSRVEPGQSHRLFSRVDAEGREQVLLDEGERAKGHAYYRATDHRASPDNRYWVWAEDVVGNDRHRIALLDTESGSIHTLVPEDAFGYGGLAFCPTSQFLFWIWRDAHSRPTRLYRTTLATDETLLVYEEHDPALFMRVARTAANGFVALTVFGPDQSEVYLIAPQAAAHPNAPELRLVRPRQAGVRYDVNEWDGMLFMTTNEGDAPDRRLLQIDPQSFEIQQEWVPHAKGRSILTVMPFARALVRLERADGLHQLVLRQRNGAEKVIRFEAAAYTLALPPDQDYAATHVRLIQQAPNQPARWIDADLNTGALTIVGEETLQGFDPDQYVVERLYATAPDGETVPLTVLSRRDAGTSPQAKAQPLLLTGYGAYGIAFEPQFSLPALALVDAGFRYAIAHVRGGSEKGHHWYQAGCRTDKRNSMTDFIACAQHLQAIGYAAVGQIVAQGVSAGGLLVCGAMNMAPQLWAGVIAQVPFVDMLNTMSDANHPLVPLLRPDWGDPLADANAYDHMIALSPYESVHAAPYPPVLCTAGLKDDRVPYWEPAKLLAAIRHQSTSTQPAVLWLDPDSGHQNSDDQNTEWAHAAMLWAFAQQCIANARR